MVPDEATAADRDPAPNHRGQEPAAAAASAAIARRLLCLMTSILRRPALSTGHPLAPAGVKPLGAAASSSGDGSPPPEKSKGLHVFGARGERWVFPRFRRERCPRWRGHAGALRLSGGCIWIASPRSFRAVEEIAGSGGPIEMGLCR